jgi:hypothetical protein
LSIVNQVLHPNFSILPLPTSPRSGGGKLGLRVTSETTSPQSTAWTSLWNLPESHFQHSQVCKDSPPTNSSSQLLDTASDAISDLALSPRCYIKGDGDDVEKHEEDCLYDLIGTLTQRAHDQLRLPAGEMCVGAKYSQSGIEAESEIAACPEDSGKIDDEAKSTGAFRITRGRSRSRKPVSVPLAKA